MAASAPGIVGLNYLGLGAAGFQKRAGRIGIANTCLLAPYQAAAWINSRIWTRRDPQPVPIADGVWLAACRPKENGQQAASPQSWI